jgi:hypothetical protein
MQTHIVGHTDAALQTTFDTKTKSGVKYAMELQMPAMQRSKNHRMGKSWDGHEMWKLRKK